MVSCCTVRRIRWEITRNGLIVLRADQSFSELEGRPVGVQSRYCVGMPVEYSSHVMFHISPFLRQTSPLMVGKIWASGQGVGTDGVCALFLPLSFFLLYQILSPFDQITIVSSFLSTSHLISRLTFPVVHLSIQQSPAEENCQNIEAFPVAINQEKYLGCHIRQRSVLVGVGEKRRLQPLAGARKNRQFATFLEGE